MSIAPDWRAISRPCLKAISVGMPRIRDAAVAGVYALPAIWRIAQAGYGLEHVRYLLIAAVAQQAVISLASSRKQMRLRLGSPAATQLE